MRLADGKETSLLLQECTSAVSIDAEEQLYKAAVEQNITTITISQRNTLPVRAHVKVHICTHAVGALTRMYTPPFAQEFHTQHLMLGENSENGWSLREVEAGQKNVVASAV